MEKRRRFTGAKAQTYVASEDTKQVVNLALALRRPILVEGEPGCGKTMLATAIAEDLGFERDRIIAITVKSSSQAKDLLYRFDALRRLQDIQDPKRKRARYIHPYISLEPLGQAIAEGRECVVLIDEIDKGDIDFPNDLLEVFDRFRFTVDDLPADEEELWRGRTGFGRTVEGPTAASRPIVVITSNREKQLPEPFLRRCLYLYLRFPEDSDQLADIVRRNLQKPLGKISEELIRAAVPRFIEIRNDSKLRAPQKLPATGELIDWIYALHVEDVPATRVEIARLHPPLWRMLFKTVKDLDSYPTESKATESLPVQARMNGDA